MKIHVLPSGPIRTNAYLLSFPEHGEAVLIDAPGDIWHEIAPILEDERCKLSALWITHGHWDHIQGAPEVVEKTGAKVIAHEADQALIETPDVMNAFLGEDLGILPVKVTQWAAQGDLLPTPEESAEVRHVPGHCPGNILFYFPKSKNAFVGDAIFAGSIGRTDLPGGSFETLEQSIRQQIYTLPDDTVLLPGHGPVTRVDVEKKSNPYVRA